MTIFKVFFGTLLPIYWLLLDLQIKVINPSSKGERKNKNPHNNTQSQAMINIPSAIIQRNVLFLEIQCGYHYLGPLLTCLYRHCVKWTVTIPWHLPHLKCWKTKLSRKGKMDVFPSTMLLRFSSEFRFRQMLAEKILQVLCGINHTDLNSMLPL